MKNEYEISADGTTVTIWLKRKNGERLACLIDAADLPKLKALDVSWYAHYGRSFYAHCNVRVGRKRTTLPMHRFLMEPPQDLEVDHKYHKTLDNRRNHLEIKTHRANMMNRHGANRDNRSGHRGISLHVGGRFQLRVTIDGKVKYIGLFSTIAEAIAVRDKFPGYGKKQLGHSEESL
jgi:hypothetical protein